MNFNLIDSRVQDIFRTVLECFFFPFERAFVSRVGGIQEESQCGFPPQDSWVKLFDVVELF